MRSIPPSIMKPWAAELSATLNQSLGHILGKTLAPSSWIQATIHLSLGGLGITDPTAVISAARLSSILVYSSLKEKLRVPESWFTFSSGLKDSISHLQILTNRCSPELNNWEAVSSLLPNPTKHLCRQEYWSTLVHTVRHHDLVSLSTARDRCRLQCLSSLSSGAWLTVVSSPSLSFSFASYEFSLLLRWWLGEPQKFDATSFRCPSCGEESDVFGDHAVSCKLSGSTMRHNVIADTLTRILTSVGLNMKPKFRLAPMGIVRPIFSRD